MDKKSGDTLINKEIDIFHEAPKNKKPYVRNTQPFKENSLIVPNKNSVTPLTNGPKEELVEESS
jgi:hypothetical protein